MAGGARHARPAREQTQTAGLRQRAVLEQAHEARSEGARQCDAGTHDTRYPSTDRMAKTNSAGFACRRVWRSGHEIPLVAARKLAVR